MARLKLSPAVAALNPGVAASLTTSERKQPARPRLAPGEGDRHEGLVELTDAGWTRYTWDYAAGDVHYFTSAAGERGPEFESYRAAVDGMLKLCKEATHG